jgi:archaemetzincin
MKRSIIFQYSFLVVLTFICYSCDIKSNSKNGKTNLHQKSDHEITTVQIIPLGKVDSNIVIYVKASIKAFYNYNCEIKDEVPLSPELLAKSKSRYDATKILNTFKSEQNILLLTENDIAYFKNEQYPEWGIFGLGFRPGSTCVVSTYRLKKGVSKNKFLERLKKVCIHEIGHNLGLPHCTYSSTCLMNDANGTIAQVDREQMFFCTSCKKKIGLN